MKTIRFNFEGIKPESDIDVQAARPRAAYTFEPEDSPYQDWMNNEMVRRRQYVARPEPGLLSFVTPAWNTPVEYLSVLAESIIQQDFGAGETFEWVIVDNGSTNPDTCSYFRNLSQHNFIRLIRLDRNTGIVEGTRVALQHARGRYVLPIDHDDYVYPDAARIVSSYIQTHEYPALLFSDEDKLVGNRFEEVYLKPDWDPVLFIHSCYTAHMGAIDRALALSVCAYSDTDVSGCPDWDTFIRFMVAAYVPTHIPEVLYSWRKHPGSTAENIDSKDYIHSSHQKALGRFLTNCRKPYHFELTYSPFFSSTPDWRFRRIPAQPRPLSNIRIGRPTGSEKVACIDPGSPISEFAGLLDECTNAASLVRLSGEDVVMNRDDWEFEALAMLELFPDAAAVGGPLFNPSGQALASGVYFGFGNGCSMPDRLRKQNDSGYFVQMFKPHTVSAMSAQNLVVWANFLQDALMSDLIDENAPVWTLGEWLGLVAAAWGRRIVFSPFLAGKTREDWYQRWSVHLIRAMITRHPKAFTYNPYYSTRLSLEEGKGYQFAPVEDRREHLQKLFAQAGVAVSPFERDASVIDPIE